MRGLEQVLTVWRADEVPLNPPASVEQLRQRVNCSVATSLRICAPCIRRQTECLNPRPTDGM